MNRLRYQMIGWLVVVLIRGLFLTCRFRRHGLSPEVDNFRGSARIFAVYHAHQLLSFLGTERRSGVLVSRSRDGEIVTPLIRSGGLVPIRGSSGIGRKGGVTAARHSVNHLQKGRPVCMTIDGPKGPRGKVHRGVAMLARRANVPVICVSAVCSRRWIIDSSWDRFQIPKPFSRIDLYLDTPLHRAADETDMQFAQRIERRLQEMECEYDPDETVAAASRAAGPDQQPQTRRKAA